MTIAPSILEQYPDLNEVQREIVGHMDGPLLVVAGPGSGKTYSIVLRALNLLLLSKALPREIVLCTFTEKAAFEMRDRLSAAHSRGLPCLPRPLAAATPCARRYAVRTLTGTGILNRGILLIWLILRRFGFQSATIIFSQKQNPGR